MLCSFCCRIVSSIGYCSAIIGSVIFWLCVIGDAIKMCGRNKYWNTSSACASGRRSRRSRRRWRRGGRVHVDIVWCWLEYRVDFEAYILGGQVVVDFLPRFLLIISAGDVPGFYCVARFCPVVFFMRAHARAFPKPEEVWQLGLWRSCIVKVERKLTSVYTLDAETGVGGILESYQYTIYANMYMYDVYIRRVRQAQPHHFEYYINISCAVVCAATTTTY